MKWAYVKFKDLRISQEFKFTLVPIPQGLTVVQFRSLWREEPESVVYVPTRMLPLHDQDQIYSYIDEFDTIILASSWVGAHRPMHDMARSASTMP
ncbi:hypothetical protein HY229_03610 [Candidatus Acetothermia bacterium]|nr:hypothetical protein [Candidatus Acetothermia bacterium]MBI3643171.1 hypothetical protein [Candidatus Acetothermia bacterium]